MAYRRIVWVGSGCSFSVKRTWQNFWAPTPVCYLNGLNKTVALPIAATEHLLTCYDLAERARQFFPETDSWYRFSVRACSDYCDQFVLRRPRAGNAFAVSDLGRAMAELAIASQGYAGPSQWWQFTGEHP